MALNKYNGKTWGALRTQAKNEFMTHSLLIQSPATGVLCV